MTSFHPQRLSLMGVQTIPIPNPSTNKTVNLPEVIYCLELTYFSGDSSSILQTSINRTYHDMHRLHAKLRAHMSSTSERVTLKSFQFPSTKLKNLVIDMPASSSLEARFFTPFGWKLHGENWQPKFTKSLGVINNYFTDMLAFCAGNGNSEDSWDDDKNSTHHLLKIFCLEDLYVQSLIDFRLRKERESKSRQLQQYFMATSNINMIVQLATEDLKPPVQSQSDSKINKSNEDERKTTDWSNNTSLSFLFIEPSCGDGRVLEALTLAYPSCDVVGNDLDAEMVQISQRRLEQCITKQTTALSTSRHPHQQHHQYQTHSQELQERVQGEIPEQSPEQSNFNQGRCPYRGVLVGDFMKTTQAMFTRRTGSGSNKASESLTDNPLLRVKVTPGQKCNLSIIEQQQEQEQEQEEVKVIVVGGPPYTLGGGTGLLHSTGRGQDKNDRKTSTGSSVDCCDSEVAEEERHPSELSNERVRCREKRMWVDQQEEEEEDDGPQLPLHFLVHACTVLQADR